MFFRRVFSVSKNSLKPKLADKSNHLIQSVSYEESHAKLEALKVNPKFKSIFEATTKVGSLASAKPIEPKLIEEALKKADVSRKYSVY